MVKKVIAIALYSIRQWTAEIRIFLLFTLMIMFIWNDIIVIGRFASMMDMYTNPLVFSFYSSDPVKQLILFSGIIFLFSDAPFINQNQPYVMIRSRRLPWVLGQILYIMIASAVYYLVLMCVSVIVLLPDATFATNGWGKIINTLAQTNAGEQINLPFGIGEKITTFYSPVEAFLLSFLLNWGVAVSIGLLIFLISMKISKMVGLLSAAVILFWDLLVVNALPVKSCYFSPVTLSRLEALDVAGVSAAPNITYALAFLGVCVAFLSALLIISVRKQSIEIMTEI
ncbi:MAG: hypothetical protein J1F02_07485 [Lachnospiraceae bacterium]|nr:hypothetical protein [Lachnospiraceae bacterium]